MPTPLLYITDKALYSRRGALDGLNTSLLELAPMPALLLIPTPTLTMAIPLPVSAVDWEQIKKIRSILQAEYIEIYSCCKAWWFQMGLAIEGNNIGVYKACIKDINSFKDPTLPSLFSKSNGFNLGPIPSFLPILTAVEKLLIAYIYIYLQVVHIHG